VRDGGASYARVLVIGLLPVYAMLIGLLFGMYGS
jgi:hypothetical protein